MDQSQDSPVESQSEVGLPLDGVNVGEAEMGAQQARIKADRLLEQIYAFCESFLLKPDGSEH